MRTVHLAVAMTALPLLAVAVAQAGSPIVVTGGTGEDIAAAIKSADRQANRISPGVGGFTRSNQSPTVVICGNFNVTRPIPLPHSSRLVAEGATLDCRHMPDDQFVFAGGGWRCEISGRMALVDAPNGIQWNTGAASKNRAMGSSLISGIHFAGVRGVAVDLQCRSSVVVVERCIFDGVSKILRNRMCDDVTMRNCFANVRGVAGDPPITTEYGRLTIRGGIFTPPSLARSAAGMAWIEILPHASRHQMVLLDGVRFGGEFGGMAVVVNRSPGRTRYPSAPGVCITLRDLHAGNTPSAGDRAEDPETGSPLVILEQMPNHLVIDGCYGMVRPKHLVDFAPGVDGEAIAAAYSSSSVNSRCIMQLQRHGTLRPGDEVPATLRKFVVGPAAQVVTQKD